jgi:hypothetical protein
VLRGRGATAVWNDSGARRFFEWQAGSLFAVPLTAWHQHFNGAGSEAVRYLGVTNAPQVFNLYYDPEFVFRIARDFLDRFDGREGYFSSKRTALGYLWVTNFVANVRTMPLREARERGAGGGHVRFKLAGGALESHISEFPVGTYKKAHRHGPGAHVIVVSGSGYSLMWPEGQPSGAMTGRKGAC